MLRHPLHIYCNWSAYDELSDRVPLTEELAMRQLEHLLRLRRAGVRLDAYIMDCFWYEPASAYRQFRRAHWRDNGKRWIGACQRHGVLPGLWFACNNTGRFCGLEVAESWRGSVDPATDPHWAAACLFEGPFLPDLMAVFDLWYQRGVRLFKLDFLKLDAQLPHHRLSLLAGEIKALNAEAFRTALRTFRRTHPESVMMAYNGFEEDSFMAGTDFVPRKTLDHRWLEAVDCFYSGDPRPADVPAMNFWRSKDVYSDHMVRAYLAQGFRPAVIDNAGFMIGTTGTCYHRGTKAWKGMLLLALARGGWATTYYGNLELLEDADAAWFARVQALLAPLVQYGACGVLGALPGTGLPYGFTLEQGEERFVLAVNPGQAEAALPLPAGAGRVLFQDAGFVARLTDTQVVLGAEQMAVIGYGRFAAAACDLGIQEDVRIPLQTSPLPLTTGADGRNRLCGSTHAPATGAVRLVVRQRVDGTAKRTTGGAPPAGRTLGTLLTLTARQDGRELPVVIHYDHAIWSGLSWAVGEIAADALQPHQPLELTVTSHEAVVVALTMEAWAVTPG